jgi:hypothetical protein
MTRVIKILIGIKSKLWRIILFINPDRFVRPYRYWTKKDIEAGKREAERLGKLLGWFDPIKKEVKK